MCQNGEHGREEGDAHHGIKRDLIEIFPRLLRAVMTFAGVAELWSVSTNKVINLNTSFRGVLSKIGYGEL